MRLWQNFFRSWSQQKITQFSTLCVLVAVYATVTSSVLIQQNLKNILTRWGTEVKVNVYLTDDISKDEMGKVSGELESSGLFKNTKFINKDEAYKRFKNSLGSFAPEISENSGFDNPLPMSLESVMSSRAAKSDAFDVIVGLAEKINLMAGVEEVSYGQGWIENYSSLINIFAYCSWALALVLIGGSLFVVGNSIKSSIIQRKEEIEIMELFGATKWSIRAPFVFEGLITGTLASIISIAVIYVLYAWQSHVLVDNLNFWNLKSSLEFLDIQRISLIVFGGAMSGALGSYLSIKQISTGWTAAEGS